MRLLTRLFVPFLLAGGLTLQALPASAATVPVSMACGPVQFCFSPATVTIQAGDTVVWTNATTVPHTATANDRAWDTGRVDPGQSRSIAFPTPGSFGYFCTFHPETLGTLVVTAAPTPTPAPTGDPTPTPTPTPTRRPAGLSPTGGAPLLPAVAALTLIGLALLRRRR
jgi:plastocyanin